MKKFCPITGLLAGMIVGSQIIISAILWMSIQTGSYADEDLLIGQGLSLVIGVPIGGAIGVCLEFLMTRLKVTNKSVDTFFVSIALLSIICKIYLSSNVLPTLVAAARSNNFIYLRGAIKLHSNLNVKDLNGQTPLIKSSEHGNLEFSQLLIKAEADLNIQDNRGWTALMAATYGRGFSGSEYCAIAQQLIKAGADTNIKDHHGQNALILASDVGDSCIVALLIEGKTDLNTQDNRGWTALMKATYESRFDKKPEYCVIIE
ncbi:MAG: ankyrin repeat domain-containing protein, partial [Desertifilum sp. SIO1I2]|nr:ankyrin repeat domain-containing protein [Desertifilum sp. SIO1I2]